MAEKWLRTKPEGERIMTDKEALQAVAHGERLPQPIVRRLWWDGLIEVTEVPAPESSEREYKPSFITPLGQRALVETQD